MIKEAINTTCLDCNTSLEICTCMDDTIDIKEELKFKNRQIGAAGFVANKIMENAVSKFNQETLEEAANRILSKEGVKLHPSGLETYLKGNVINAMVEIAKWQREKSYSKEEVFGLMYKAFEAGFKKYDVVEAGLEGLETEIECNWILKKFGKNN